MTRCAAYRARRGQVIDLALDGEQCNWHLGPLAGASRRIGRGRTTCDERAREVSLGQALAVGTPFAVSVLKFGHFRALISALAYRRIDPRRLVDSHFARVWVSHNRHLSRDFDVTPQPSKQPAKGLCSA